MVDLNLDEILPTGKGSKSDWLESRVRCPECGCVRKIKNCKRHTETESWEMPWIKYEVCICPKCGSDMEE